MKILLAITLAWLANVVPLGCEPVVVEDEGAYQKIQLSENADIRATLEVFEADNLIVVITVCAPECSSRAGVYNKEGVRLYPIEPTVKSVFPLATMNKQTGHITWSDNDTWEY